MKKGIVIVAVLISTAASAQSLGGLIGRAASALGGSTDCTATYAISEAGVFGPDTSIRTKPVSGRNISDACQKAKAENDSDSGVFGNSTKVLRSLSCRVRGVNLNVDVDTCEARP